MKSFLVGACVTVVSLAAVTMGRAYPSGPDGGVTGGFGEQTCQQSGCHTSFPLNQGRTATLGDLLIGGLPAQFEPGRSYPITLTVSHVQDRLHWGFQLSARLEGSGRQAGRLESTDDRTQVIAKDGIQYVEHTLAGIATNTFTFTWVAPGGGGRVVLHAAGNAADGDGSPEGDYIYSTSATTAPVP